MFETNEQRCISIDTLADQDQAVDIFYELFKSIKTSTTHTPFENWCCYPVRF